MNQQENQDCCLYEGGRSMNTNYSEYYRGTTMVNTYGSAAGEKQVVKYEFNTTDDENQ
jgi:hypothetical protein